VDLCGYLWIFVDIASSLINMLVGLLFQCIPSMYVKIECIMPRKLVYPECIAGKVSVSGIQEKQH
jgi:hypothetical protein